MHGEKLKKKKPPVKVYGICIHTCKFPAEKGKHLCGSINADA